MKPGQASFMFGVPPTTLLMIKKRKALTQMVGVSPEPKQAAKAVKTIIEEEEPRAKAIPAS